MSKKRHPPSVPYDDAHLEDLKDPKEAAAYLEAAIEDEDPGVFCLALRDVARARGLTTVARKANLGRESLYKALSANGNPEFRTVNKLLDAVGLRLSVKRKAA